jgi:nucleotide-binding universal stress UspA family protein
MMSKLLLPVDGSDSAMRAVKHAIQLAKGRDDAKVNLLYVHYEPVRFGAVAPQVEPGQMKEIERQAAGSVFSEPEKLLREAGINFEHEVRAGRDVAPLIAKRAEELGCDAIVMGSHGGGSLANMLLGSTATKVANIAKVPVTLVK